MIWYRGFIAKVHDLGVKKVHHLCRKGLVYIK